MQTLKQAIHAIYAGRWAPPPELDGKPVGAWPETVEAHAPRLEERPARPLSAAAESKG